MEQALLTAMVEAVRTGLRAESGFKKDAWKTAVTSVTNVLQTPREITIDQCKSKMTWFKSKYKEWCILYTQSGWNFDNETQLFIAEDSAWQAHFKVFILSIITRNILTYICRYILTHGLYDTIHYAIAMN